MKPLKILDLFCGAGGAAMGLRQGLDDLGIPHEIYGVDNRMQKHYPFHFVLGDALTPPFDLREFDFVWASPPCQAYSWSARKSIHLGKVHPDLVKPTRSMLQKAGVPYAMENVIGAPMQTVIRLCGFMFDLSLVRHRNFETSRLVLQPPHMRHRNEFATVAGHGGDKPASFGFWKTSMGIDWMDRYELTQAIPPAYSRYIIKQVFGNQ